MTISKYQTAQQRLKNIFTYIRELTKLRTPPVSSTSKYDWSSRFSSLPTYPSIKIYPIIENEAEDFDGVLLRVLRPQETLCPKHPKELDGWLESGWDNISNQPKALFAKNSIVKDQTITESFDDSKERIALFDKWLGQREAWANAERPVREAIGLFSNFFTLYGQLQREAEKYQLYIGDGHLVWDSAIESVDHPILIKKVELEFNSSVPEFIVKEIDESSELYTSLLRHHELDGKSIIECKSKLEASPVHPLAANKSTEFFKYFIQRFFQNGRFVNAYDEIENGYPSIYKDPILFLGGRVQGLTESLDRLIEATETSDNISEALLRMAGVDEKINPNTNESSSIESISSQSGGRVIDFLLTKPANKEQERVIERLETTGSVLVQGPPGTGKSHTIANIIGHLLASGKTVLVSSHTSKALRVVRDKVAKDLQPLCVSVLENDSVSKGQLEDSVNGIVSYLSKTDSTILSNEILQLGNRRTQLKDQISKLEAEALRIRKGEYEDIVVSGKAIEPSEAARRVAVEIEEHGWIPGSIKQGASLTLSAEELSNLYKTNALLNDKIERCVIEGLPEISKLIEPGELGELFNHISSITSKETEIFESVWTHSNQDILKLNAVADDLIKALDIFTAHEWVQKIVDETLISEEHVKLWMNLIAQVNSTINSIASRTEIILQHGPVIETQVNEKLLQTARSILIHVKLGKKLDFFNTVFNSEWKNFIKSVKVDAGQPFREEHFESLVAYIECYLMRNDLSRRWERQVCSIGGPRLDGEKPEAKAQVLLNALVLATKWNSETWRVIENGLLSQGFQLQDTLEKFTAKSELESHISVINQFAKECLVPAIKARELLIKLKRWEVQRTETAKAIKENIHKAANSATYLYNMLEAIETKNLDIYKIHYQIFLELHLKVNHCNDRMVLLEKLELVAPQWASAIASRTGIHGGSEVPGVVEKAWTICQWKQELDKRLQDDYSKVQKDISRLKNELQDVNAQFVGKMAWRFQLSRTGLIERQALIGWQQLQNRITKSGTGKRDPILKKEAQKTLKNCKNAVPVWIMPLSRVYESFDLVNTKFDVLILDEASQSDITALIAFSIAKQVIVVGDKEQVTPYAVGEELSKIQVLIDEILKDVPNKLLYTGRTSVYDLAEQSFGETIRLVEHFRCVPDIIQFSNNLSYGDIRPLREASSSPYKKQLIAHRIQGATSTAKKNQKEATEIASMIVAMSDMKEYADASIGVISMVGTEQAILIDSILQRKLPTDKYSKHSILCGNASQFQGDERKVIFISMVDTCDDPPLSIRQDDSFKKTFNVAASRAQDQLWVVHSLNPSTDLKPNDLRLRLIKHAENPQELENQIRNTQNKADPKSEVFEPMVIRDLMQAGFRVTPQWKVGAYTIDMIVEGLTKRIAIECDGDRFHPIEKLVEDIERQMVLERLGWKFIRIRGTEYFRYKEKTMKRVMEELDSLGIERLGGEELSSPRLNDTDDLHQTVLARAEEIRILWEAEPVEENNKSKRSGWKKTYF